jgi:hypothetical protein
MAVYSLTYYGMTKPLIEAILWDEKLTGRMIRAGKNDCTVNSRKLISAPLPWGAMPRAREMKLRWRGCGQG